MRHATAMCEMMLAMLVSNWSDLHANGMRLLKDVGVFHAIT